MFYSVKEGNQLSMIERGLSFYSEKGIEKVINELTPN